MNYDHLVSPLREGVAEHGAAAAVLQTRVAELTQQRAECERQFQEQQRRAERAESDLAAARASLRELIGMIEIAAVMPDAINKHLRVNWDDPALQRARAALAVEKK